MQYGHREGFNLVLLTVWEHNTLALILYQILGFKLIGSEDFVLGQDVQLDYIMKKDLYYKVPSCVRCGSAGTQVWVNISRKDLAILNG